MIQLYKDKLCRNFYFLIFLLLIHQPIYSQVEYMGGYIINNSSDTTKGYILNEDWERSPKEVTFKKDLSDAPQILTTNEVKAFCINKFNRFYLAKNIRYNIYRSDVHESESFVLKEVTETVFIERLKSVNSINLYSVFDEKGNQRFYIEKQGEWTELINYTYTVYVNGTGYESKHDSYKEQLKYLFPDCKAIEFNSVRYVESSLNNFFNQYFRCFRGIVIKEESTANKVSLNLLATGGMSFGSHYTKYAQIYSVGLKVSLPRNFRNNYAIVEGGVFYKMNEQGAEIKPFTSIAAGSYIGPWKFQPYFNFGMMFVDQDLTGIPLSGGIIAGVGISYKKKIQLEFRNNRILMFKYCF